MATTGAEKQRLTAFPAISSSNEVLPLFIILKGKRLSKDIQKLQDDDLTVTISDNGWMTETTMLHWIDTVWKPYSSKFSRSLLLLDQFKAHLTPKVLAAFEACNSDILFIPKGLTSVYQPCDAYLNKPLKDLVRKCWLDFMNGQNDLGIRFSDFTN